MDLCWGIIEDINDPIKGQRVKVRISGYYDNMDVEDLPWCPVLRSSNNPISFNVGNSTHNLDKGCQVLCVWLDHYNQQPLVLGQIPRLDDCNVNTNLDKNVIKTKSGHIITIDNTINNPNIDIKDNKQNHIRLDADGVTVETSKDSISGLKGNLLFNISGDSNINVKGNCNITSTGNNNFQAVKNNINGDVSITGNLTTTGKVTAPSSEILSMSSTAITTTTASIGGISIDNVSAELITKHVHTAPSGGGITSGPTPQ